MKNYIISTTIGESNDNKSSQIIDNLHDAIAFYEKEVEALEHEYTNIKELNYSPTDEEMRSAITCEVLEWDNNGDFENDFSNCKGIKQSDYYMPR